MTQDQADTWAIRFIVTFAALSNLASFVLGLAIGGAG